MDSTDLPSHRPPPLAHCLLPLASRFPPFPPVPRFRFSPFAPVSLNPTNQTNQTNAAFPFRLVVPPRLLFDTMNTNGELTT